MVELGDFYAGETRTPAHRAARPRDGRPRPGPGRRAHAHLRRAARPGPAHRDAARSVSTSCPPTWPRNEFPQPRCSARSCCSSAQQAKRASEDALARGDYDTARATLDGAATALAAVPPAAAGRRGRRRDRLAAPDPRRPRRLGRRVHQQAAARRSQPQEPRLQEPRAGRGASVRTTQCSAPPVAPPGSSPATVRGRATSVAKVNRVVFRRHTRPTPGCYAYTPTERDREEPL